MWVWRRLSSRTQLSLFFKFLDGTCQFKALNPQLHRPVDIELGDFIFTQKGVSQSTGGGGGASDTDLITNLLNDYGAALQAQDVAKAMTAFADDFDSDQGLGKAEQEEFLQGAADGGLLEDLEIDQSELEIVIDGASATAGPLVASGAFPAITFSYKLEKRGGQWLITYSSQS